MERVVVDSTLSSSWWRGVDRGNGESMGDSEER